MERDRQSVSASDKQKRTRDMAEFRVFVGAPPPNALGQESTSYHWQSVSSLPSSKQVVFPPSTLNAASQRISVLYQNVIFDQVDERHSEWACDDKDPGLGMLSVRLTHQ
jgi:hypothetical protein